MDKKTSYTAADIFPAKLAQRANNCQFHGKIQPTHVQLCPTNKCNLNCSFCSCSDREKGQKLSIDRIAFLISDMASLGTNAVTITGGGEPTLYPDIDRVISMCNAKRIRVGLVTNGITLKNVHPQAIDSLSWCRISVSDDRDIDSLLPDLWCIIKASPRCDFAFSYVVTKDCDIRKIQCIIDFANDNGFSHIRLVSDLMDLDNVPDMESIKQQLSNDELVIYQGRKEYDAGSKRCLISLLKPVIAPDGYIYPCCGVQYATDDTGKFPEAMRMGRMEDIRNIYATQAFFDGSVCSKCYYKNYNDFLEVLTKNLDHMEFV